MVCNDPAIFQSRGKNRTELIAETKSLTSSNPTSAKAWHCPPSHLKSCILWRTLPPFDQSLSSPGLWLQAKDGPPQESLPWSAGNRAVVEQTKHWSSQKPTKKNEKRGAGVPWRSFIGITLSNFWALTQAETPNIRCKKCAHFNRPLAELLCKFNLYRTPVLRLNGKENQQASIDHPTLSASLWCAGRASLCAAPASYWMCIEVPVLKLGFAALVRFHWVQNFLFFERWRGQPKKNTHQKHSPNLPAHQAWLAKPSDSQKGPRSQLSRKVSRLQLWVVFFFAKPFPFLKPPTKGLSRRCPKKKRDGNSPPSLTVRCWDSPARSAASRCASFLLLRQALVHPKRYKCCQRLC